MGKKVSDSQEMCCSAEYQVHLQSSTVEDFVIAMSSCNRTPQIGIMMNLLYVHLISGIAALNNKPNMRTWIRRYLVTFFPVSSIKMSFYSIEYRQGEFQVKRKFNQSDKFSLTVTFVWFSSFFSFLWGENTMKRENQDGNSTAAWCF